MQTIKIPEKNKYNSDGMHLSKKGKEKLGDLINLNLYNLLCFWKLPKQTNRQNRIVEGVQVKY